MAASFYLEACGRNRREFSPFELLRITLLGTWVNRLIGSGSSAPLLTLQAR